MMDEQQHTAHGDSIANNETLDTLRRERDEYLAGWKRAMADYENLRKETEKEKEVFRKYANEAFALRMLPAIDQFEVAMQFAPSLDTLPDEHRKAFATWMTGLEAVRSLWRDAASELGLERIAAEGAFDPNLHEAVERLPSSGTPDGGILKISEHGYTLHGKVIRPAKVVVSSGSPSNE